MNLEMLRKRCIQIACPLTSAAPSVPHLSKTFYTQAEPLSLHPGTAPGAADGCLRIPARGHVAGADPRLSNVTESALSSRPGRMDPRGTEDGSRSLGPSPLQPACWRQSFPKRGRKL